MSASSLIAARGVLVALYRPTIGRRTDGSTTKTEAKVGDYTAFVQPRGANQRRADGRETMRQTVVIYFDGVADVRTDHQIGYPNASPQYRYRVTGVRVPDEVDATFQNAHTIVDAERISPTV